MLLGSPASLSLNQSVEFVPGEVPGRYSFVYLKLVDGANNVQTYDLSHAQAAHFATQFNITAFTDTTPPVIHGFTLSPFPAIINDTYSFLTATFNVSDDIAGVQRVEADFVDPHSNNTVIVQLVLDPPQFPNPTVSGNLNSGVFRVRVNVFASGTATYTLTVVRIIDRVGNQASFTPAQAAANKWPTQFITHFSTRPPLPTPPNVTSLSCAFQLARVCA